MPEAVDDPVLGRLTWDAKLDWWVGAAEVTPGNTVEMFVCYEPGKLHEFVNDFLLSIRL